MRRGLGTTVPTLLKLLEGTPEHFTVMEYVAREPGNPTGANQHTPTPQNDQGGINCPTTNSSQHRAKTGGRVEYRIRQLSRLAKREREGQPESLIGKTPTEELLGRVKSGELSAHRAMVEAGFRKVPTMLDVLRRAWSKATPDEKAQFALAGEGEEVARLRGG